MLYYGHFDVALGLLSHKNKKQRAITTLKVSNYSTVRSLFFNTVPERTDTYTLSWHVPQ
jgi:hypothetical protein